MKPKYYLVIIAALLLLLVLQRECQRCPDLPEPTTVTHIDTLYKWDTITQTHHTKPVLVHDTLLLPVDIDTSAVIQDYYTRREYHDTIRDSVFEVYISDTVFKNRLMWRKTDSKVFLKETIIQRTDSLFIPCPDPRAMLFFGVGVGGWEDKFSIAPGAALLTKRKHLYMINYDPFNKVAQVHTYWKIGKK